MKTLKKERSKSIKIGTRVKYRDDICKIISFHYNGHGIQIEGYSNGHEGGFNPDFHHDDNGEYIEIPRSKVKNRYYIELHTCEILETKVYEIY